MLGPSHPPDRDEVLLRPARPADTAALVQLAELDSADPLAGPALVAEVNGSLGAALCLSTGRVVADPFRPSSHLVELLHHHARCRAGGNAPRGHRRARLRRRHGLALIEPIGS